MNSEMLELKKKKLLALVIMMIIMLLTLFLMITGFSYEYIWGYKTGSSDNTNIDNEVDALGTLMLADNITFNVTASDLSKETVGNNQYVTIESKKEKANISLISNADTTVCKYNIIYETEYNYFENKYINNNGQLNDLKNQLLLNLVGYKSGSEKEIEESYTFDLIDIKNENKVLIENVYISNIENNPATSHEWTISVAFNNYRDYNQANNAGKESKGKLSFQFTECERRK